MDILRWLSVLNDDALYHYGVGIDDTPPPPGRGSGRYPKGSGENPDQHDESLAAMVRRLQKEGMSEGDIARGLGYKSSGEMRAAVTLEKENRQAMLRNKIPELRASGMSVKDISSKLGLSQTTVRNYLDERHKVRETKTQNVAKMLKEELKEKRYLDVGAGVSLSVGLSEEGLKAAVEMLKAEGYQLHTFKIEQLGNPGKHTTMMVLGAPDTEWKEVVKDPTLVKTIQSYAVNNGETVLGLKPVKSIDSSRVFIRYTEEDGSGGKEQDGLIELRRGVEDISLGKSSFAQVRIGVDGTHYMKGMAVYSDDIPDGYDVVYNSKEAPGTDPSKVFKAMKLKPGTDEVDQANPFGATIKAGGQSYCLDADGHETDQLRVINKVNDQNDWANWSSTVSAQILSKQPYQLVKRQLDLTYSDKKEEFDEIMSLTNPTIKRKLLEEFADDCDASATHLKAKAFPGQTTCVYIPVPTLKDGECYCTNYEHGDTVALFRSPHAGRFEIAVVRNNLHDELGQSRIGKASDAIGFNAHTAGILSGADFDGDSGLVVPMKLTPIKTDKPFAELKDFDTNIYKSKDPNFKPMSTQVRGLEMGKVTNLIADMQLSDGVDPEDLVRAVKHSMVVVDAPKHGLDWKQSEIDNHIQELKDKYQNGGGASTLITRAKSEVHIPVRKLGSIVDEEGNRHYGIDPATGKKIYEPSGETKKVYRPTKADPNRWIETPVLEKVHRMDLADTPDKVYDLMSSRTNPHPNELAYAEYAISMKALANEARKELVKTPRLQRSSEAAKEYAEEVKYITSELNIAMSNAPRERQAQILGTAEYKARVKANPDLKEDKAQLKRLKGQCITAARNRLGASRHKIDIDDRCWESIQKGAISDSRLTQILKYADADELRKRAMPKNDEKLFKSRVALAKKYKAMNWPESAIADRLGVSVSSVSKYLNS